MKSYLEVIGLTFIKHYIFDKFGAKIWNMDETGIVLDHELMKVLARSGTKSLYSRSSGSKEVTTFNAAVTADGWVSLIDMVEILLGVMLMDILINAFHLLLNM